MIESLINLEELDLSINGISDIPFNAFGNMDLNNHLDVVRLNDNLISSLAANAFAKLKSVTMMALQNNQLKQLVTATFTGMSSLKYLFLSNNEIIKMENYALEGNNSYLCL